MIAPRLLVVAKAPVPGLVKTRLGIEIGMQEAAEIAAASLLDTIAACREAVGPGACHLALAGDLTDAVRRDELSQALAGWTIRPQIGEHFGARLTWAHLDLAGETGPVVQIGMDTPQVTPTLLLDAAAGLADHDVVLGPAQDGGWWVLALRDPQDTRAAHALEEVPMSTPTTHDDTRQALLDAGLRVATTAVLRDVDTVADAHAVAERAPTTAFARTWDSVGQSQGLPR